MDTSPEGIDVCRTRAETLFVARAARPRASILDAGARARWWKVDVRACNHRYGELC